MTDLTERGLQVFGELLGEDLAAQLRLGLSGTGFGAPVGKLATDFVFGSIWSRDGLERRERSLVVISVLITLHQVQELKNHVRIGLNNGLTIRELEEVLIQTIPYVGFPAVATASSAVVEVLRERGLDTTTVTAEERGLL
ncbi:MAG TPA: carboxymuconolactone decarboxylase family protein [Novosphingobium sp.]|nr:carboxymuconolactone decarboxylase family protein [Novosphingobium sp.]